MQQAGRQARRARRGACWSAVRRTCRSSRRCSRKSPAREPSRKCDAGRGGRARGGHSCSHSRSARRPAARAGLARGGHQSAASRSTRPTSTRTRWESRSPIRTTESRKINHIMIPENTSLPHSVTQRFVDQFSRTSSGFTSASWKGTPRSGCLHDDRRFPRLRSAAESAGRFSRGSDLRVRQERPDPRLCGELTGNWKRAQRSCATPDSIRTASTRSRSWRPSTRSSSPIGMSW